MQISWCSVNARMGAKPVSLRIKSASVNGVYEELQERQIPRHIIMLSRSNQKLKAIYK